MDPQPSSISLNVLQTRQATSSPATMALTATSSGIPTLLLDRNAPSDRQKIPVNFRNRPHAEALGYDPDANPGGGFYASTTDANEMAAWLNYASHMEMLINVGMRTGGAVAGGGTLAVVDVDTVAAVHRWFDLWQRQGVRAPGLTVKSPGKRTADGQWAHRGGGHIWLHLPSGVAERLKPTVALVKGSDPAECVDVKIRDSLVLLPPSVRDEGAYVWADSVVPEAPGWLVDLLLEVGSIAPKRARAAADFTESEAYNEWAEDHPWDDLLADAGWSFSGELDGQCGCPVVTRPGASTPRSGIAHAPGCNAGQLHLFTTADDTVIGIYADAVGRASLSRVDVAAAVAYGADHPQWSPEQMKARYMDESGLGLALRRERGDPEQPRIMGLQERIARMQAASSPKAGIQHSGPSEGKLPTRFGGR